MSAPELQKRTDYLYCGECGRHVPCISLEPGVWEVQCSRCVGECGLCGCYVAGYCYGKGRTPVPTHMHVVDSDDPA